MLLLLAHFTNAETEAERVNLQSPGKMGRKDHQPGSHHALAWPPLGSFTGNPQGSSYGLIFLANVTFVRPGALLHSSSNWKRLAPCPPSHTHNPMIKTN